MTIMAYQIVNGALSTNQILVLALSSLSSIENVYLILRPLTRFST